MPRRVFISVLGTGFYGACKYTREAFASTETRFIQQATLEYLGVKQKWTREDSEGKALDCIIILLTDGARKTNWNKEIRTRYNRNTEKEEPYLGLEQILQDMSLPCPVRDISIPDGKDENEMWTIFNAVYEALEPGDELYFDLTHSFRYLPMLVLVLGNYAKFLKDVSVRHISYGNYEARDINTNEAPLMDILSLTILQDWTFAAADLIRNGNIERLQSLKEANALTPLLRSKGKNNLDRKVAEQPLTGYLDALNSLLQDMKLCIAPNLIKGETINDIHTFHEQVIDAFNRIIAPVPPIINRIQDSLSGFEQTDRDCPDSFLNGYVAAQWCYDHQLYQQAITILEENITTHFCLYLGLDEHVYDYRKASNAYLRHKGYKEDDWKDDKLKDVKTKAQKASSKMEVGAFIYKMSDVAKWIHEKRNTYNHASMGRDDLLTAEDIKTLGKKIASILNLVK